MTIEIIDAMLQTDEESSIQFWFCWLEIVQNGDVYLLPVTALGSLLEGELQAVFDAKETELFTLAQAKGDEPEKIYQRIDKRIVRAFALVTLDEVNIIRGELALPLRTAEQLRNAVKGKL